MKEVMHLDRDGGGEDLHGGHMTEHGLGRRVPADDDHIRLHPLGLTAPATVERTLSLPRWRAFYDQGSTSACTGFSSSWAMSILHRHKYDGFWLWDRAKECDEWDDTNPGDDQGSSVRAAFDVLRRLGPMQKVGDRDREDIEDALLANTWATSADGVRAAIGAGMPVVLGIDWYHAFDVPEKAGNDWWIGRSGDLGAARGGHAICCHAASDRRQACKLVNSWGNSYPPVWVPYSVIDRLLAEDGEACVPVLRSAS